MDYFSLGVVGFVVGLSGAMLPGPLLAYTISRVLKGRIRDTLLIVLGHIFIEAVMVVLLLLGLKQTIGSKVVHNVLSVLGGGVLVLMGLHIILKTPQLKVESAKSYRDKSTKELNLILGGVFFTAFNPTFPTWWVSVGASLLSRSLRVGAIGVVSLALGHWLADFSWFSSLSFAVHRGKSLLNDRRYQKVLKIIGIILIGIGSYFIVQIITL